MAGATLPALVWFARVYSGGERRHQRGQEESLNLLIFKSMIWPQYVVAVNSLKLLFVIIYFV